MRHDIGIEWPDRSREIRHVNFTSYGDQPNGNSAMAATVGYPTGIATMMILNGMSFLAFSGNVMWSSFVITGTKQL